VLSAILYSDENRPGITKVSARQPAKYSNNTARDIDGYLASLPENQRRALRAIRETIRAAVPDAVEALVYGVPGFKLDGKSLACYAGFKHHCGFYPMSPAVIQSYASELEDFEVSKGTIRFQPEKPLSKTLLKKLINTRVAELRNGRK
jgi:uncharacterized protein YdhG (YjbR/CyaY superfamily)